MATGVWPAGFASMLAERESDRWNRAASGTSDSWNAPGVSKERSERSGEDLVLDPASGHKLRPGERAFRLG